MSLVKIARPFVFILLLSLSGSAQNDTLSAEEEKGESCGGTERWSVKVLTDAAAGQVNLTPMATTISSLVAISTPPPSSSMARYIGIEDKTYSVVCNITIKKFEDDNDYHLVLSDGSNRMIGEVPDPSCPAAASSSFVNNYISARNFVNAYIAYGNVYNVNLPPVIVYGVAFIDPPHGQTGAAPNNLELHPILDLQFIPGTGIDELKNFLKVNVFPNPAKDKLNLEINLERGDLSDCGLMIFDMAGSLVKTNDLPESGASLRTAVSIADLASGMFFYRITKSNRPLFEGRFIKQ